MLLALERRKINFLLFPRWHECKGDEKVGIDKAVKVYPQVIVYWFTSILTC